MDCVRNFVCSVRQALFVALLLAAVVHPGLAQAPEQISAELRPMIGPVLQSRRLSYSVDPASQDIVSGQEEFHAHLQIYRARFRFHLEGDTLRVTMEDLQAQTTRGWGPALIPAKGAEAKLIDEVLAQLKATSQQQPNHGPSPNPVSPNRVSAEQASVSRPDPGLQTSNSSAPAGDSPAARGARLRNTRPDGPPRLDKAKGLVYDLINQDNRCADGLCAVSQDGLWGFFDYHANMVLGFQYHSTNMPYFTHGTCMVDAYPRQGEIYIDKKGNVLFDKKVFLSAKPFDDVVTQVTLSGRDSVTGILDLQGHFLAIRDADHISFDKFHEGLARSQTSVPGAINHFGFRNAHAQWAVPAVYDTVTPFHEGIAWVDKMTEGGAHKWGAVNKEGKVVIPFMFSQQPRPFSDGLAGVSCSDGSGYVDATGKLVIPCQNEMSGLGPFIHGHAMALGLHGIVLLIDKQGKVVVSFQQGSSQYEGIGELRADGLYPFVIHLVSGNYTGLLDSDWNIVVPPASYAGGSIGLFPADGDPDGLAWAERKVGNDSIYGLINRKGEFIVVRQKSMF